MVQADERREEPPGSTKAMRLPKRKGMTMAVKAMIGTLLGLSIVILAWVMMDRMAENQRNREIQGLFNEAAKTGATAVEMNEEQLGWILDYVSSVSFDKEKAAAYQTLALARGSASSDYDKIIAEFATEQELIEEIRVRLFQVLAARKAEAVAPRLIRFASQSPEERPAKEALDALRGLIAAQDFPDVLEILMTEESDEVRGAAERVLRAYADGKSNNRNLARVLAEKYGEASDAQVQESLIRLLGSTGHNFAAPVIEKAIGSGEENLQAAALTALENWRDDSQFEMHLSLLEELEGPYLREQAFESLVNFLTGGASIKEANERGYWEAVTSSAESQKQKLAVISGLVRLRKDWSADLVSPFRKDSDGRVKALAEKALKALSQKKEEK